MGLVNRLFGLIWPIPDHPRKVATQCAGGLGDGEGMPVSPLAVANTFVDKFGRERGIDPLKLQKLDYCVHGWWLAEHPLPILSERPQVWKRGPVFPSLYHDLKVFGMRPVKEPQSSDPFEEAPLVPATEVDLLKLISWVWKRYGHLTGNELSEMTHRKGSAWRQIAEARNFVVPRNTPIPDDDVRAEFQSLIHLMTPKAQ